MKIFEKILRRFQKQERNIIRIENIPSWERGITLKDYAHLSYAYTCAEVRAENFASASLYVEDEQGNITELEKVEEIANLFTSLGMFSHFDFFYLSCLIRDLIKSGVYYYIVRNSSNKPISLFIIPPTFSVQAIYNPRNALEILYYKINLGMNKYLEVPAENIINIRRLSFYDFREGFSVLEQYEEVIKTYIELTSFLHSQTTNHALPPKMVIEVEDEVTSTIVEETRQRWRERREAFLRGEDIFITTGKFRQLGPSVQELDYAETRRLLREEIRAAFRVPKILLGETDEINRATADASRRSFIENVINPLWRFYLSKLNMFLRKEFKVSLTFDYIQSMPFNELVDTLLKPFRAGVITINEVREDLGYNRIVGGDRIWVPLNMVEKEVSYEDTAKKPGGKKRREVKEPPFLAWARNNRVFEKGTKLIKPVILKWFDMQVNNVLKKLNEEGRRGWGLLRRDLADNLLSNWDKWVDEIKREWEAVLRKIIEIAAERGAEMLDLEVPSYDEFFVEQAIIRGLRRIEEINEFTRELLARQIREGLLKNESIEQIAQRIKAVYEALKTWRAERIAWTESTHATNTTLLASFKENGVEKKMWLSSRDERVRDSHKALDGKIVKIDEYFETIKGNLLLYPGDTRAPAGEVVNCRCTIVPI